MDDLYTDPLAEFLDELTTSEVDARTDMHDLGTRNLDIQADHGLYQSDVNLREYMRLKAQDLAKERIAREKHEARLHAAASTGLPSFLIGNAEDSARFADAAASMRISIPQQLGGPEWGTKRARIQPTMLEVEGGQPLLYPGRSHSLSGRGGSGKTMLAIRAIVCVVRNGGKAVFVDFEEPDENILSERLYAMGVTAEEAENIAFWHPHGSIMADTPLGQVWLAWLALHRPELVVIDSVAMACKAASLDHIKPTDYDRFDGEVVEHSSRLKIATLLIDHTGKPGERQDFSSKVPDPIGAASKIHRLTGAAYGFVVKKAFSIYDNGFAELHVLKCRPGTFPEGTIAAEMHVHVEDEGDSLEITMRAPGGAGQGPRQQPMPTGVMQMVSKWLEQQSTSVSGNQIETEMRAAGKGAKADTIRKALRVLIAAELVSKKRSGNSYQYTSLGSYREGSDLPQAAIDEWTRIVAESVRKSSTSHR